MRSGREVGDGPAALPAELVDVVHRIVSDPGRLSKSWCDGILAKSLDDGLDLWRPIPRSAAAVLEEIQAFRA